MNLPYERRRSDPDARRWEQSEKPPGSWHGDTSHRRVRRDRSRSPPRHRHTPPDRHAPPHEYPRYHGTAPATPDPRRLIAELGPDAFSRFTLECIRLLQPAEFANIWHNVPIESQRVAYGVPPGIRIDIDNIRDDQERKSICRKINELRRERCFQLSSPSQRDHWHDESWTMTPMSRETCRQVLGPLPDDPPGKHQPRQVEGYH